MPSPKDGKAGNLVSPASPRSAHDADNADPGEIQDIKAQQKAAGTGKYGSTPVKPFKPGNDGDDSDKKKSWIEIELVDEDNQPMSGVPYEITLPNGSVASGSLDGKGLARIDGINQGQCSITFPNLDRDAWS